jgi:hypothetical protein
MAKGPADAEHFAGFVNLRKKDTGHKMASMFEKLEPSNPECEVSHEDVEYWIRADKGTTESRTIADVALIYAVMKPDPESETLDNESFRRKKTLQRIFRGPKLPTRILHLRSSPKAGHVTRHRK